MTEVNQPAASSSDNTKLFSILAYLSPLWLVGLLAAKENKEVMFHVNQGIILTIASVAGSMIASIIGVIPFVGFVTILLLPAISIFCIVLVIMGIMNAVNGKQEPLPLIGKMFTIVK